MHACTMGAASEARQCFTFYKARETQGLGETSQRLLLVLEKLEQFSGAPVKRCRDKSLDEAFQLLSGVSKVLWDLDHDDLLPLVRCILAFQMETTSSSGSFHRLEKMIMILSKCNESLVAAQTDKFMANLIEDKEVLSPGDLQIVCMFIEESKLGQRFWRSNLMPLLNCIAATFSLMLEDQTDRNEQKHYITVKACLLLFKLMCKEFSLLVWSETDDSKTLQIILRSLVQIIMGKTICKDTRLLAGTAVGMLVNTAPEPRRGAAAVLGLYQLLSQGECQFGVLHIPPCAWSPSGLEKLVFTRGLLTCCKKEILSCQLDHNSQEACLLLDVLFPAVSGLMDEQKDCRYYCFQVFSLWLQRVRESLSEIWKVTDNRFLADNSRLLQRLIQFLWTNAESPVEGVSDFIHSSFQLLLEIYTLECDHLEVTERPLYGQILQRLILMPWQARARYFPLCAVLPYLGPGKVLDIYKDLPQHILNCLSANHLCPAASDLYRAILQLQHQIWVEGQEHVPEEDLAQKWALHWLPTLSSALTSPNPFVQSSASNYLLGWTLRLFPASYTLLANSLSLSQLHAWINLLNAQKSIVGSLPADGMTLKRLSSCLFSKEENIRLAALRLLCTSPRTSQALSEPELQLLKEFLLLNLNCDSSSFRQLLQATVKKALVRLRDSSLATLHRQVPKQEMHLTRGDSEKPLERAVDFVEWLLQLCASSLMPGVNYQRRKTALLLLAAILETCTDTWSPERKKGQPPRNMTVLLSWARSKGCWDFFSKRNTMILLSCLQDSTNEIHELASELLLRYFPPAFPDSIAVALFELAQEALSNPRVQDVEGGATQMKTFFQKSDTRTLRRILPEAKEEPALQCPCLRFAEYLLGVLQIHFATAQRDLLQAARSSPIHGVISALRRFLLEVPEVAVAMLKPQLLPCWRRFLNRLVNSMRDISCFLMGVLQSKQTPNSDQQAAAPSFADMGNAIGSLIQLGKGLEGQSEDISVLLSEEHSLILTCCWVSVKEIGLLLGGLAEVILPLLPPAASEPLLPLQLVKMAAEIFQEVLLKCRHWGAVEGCSMGFIKFCATLLNHPDPELQDIPRTMLSQGLALLNGPRSTSVTRRAAGFPMLFLCIVAGEDSTKPRPLLAHCTQALLALASTPFPQDWDHTVDLPQVSAVHVLQTLIRGSSGLGTARCQDVTSMVILVLKALGSPCWAMRNAAIQLFGALTVRLLGQKWSRDDGPSQGGVSPGALFTCYPQLKSILLGELALAVKTPEEPQGRRFRLYPSLYAVLTFLAKLQPSRDNLDSNSACFLKPLIQLSGNPIYSVRMMASKALVPFVPVEEYGNILLYLASALPQLDNVPSHNALHGCLLQIHSVLAQALNMNCLSPDVLLSISSLMEERIWLVTPLQRCPLVRLAYLQVISLLVGSISEDFSEQIQEVVINELDCPKPVKKPGLTPVQVGSAAFCQLAIRFLCSEAGRLANFTRIGRLCLLLERGNAEIQVAILTWMIETEAGKGLTFSKDLQLTLLGKLEGELKGRSDRAFLKLYLEVFVHIFSNPSSHDLLFSQKPLSPWRTECSGILLSMTESNGLGPELLSHALCVVALLLTPSFEDYGLLVRWCAAIEQCSDPLSSEVLRMTAAKSLKLAGTDLVCGAQDPTGSGLRSVAVRLMDVALCLLQDECPEVRHEASIFASLVVQQQPEPGTSLKEPCAVLQSNKGLVSLLHLLLEKFWDCPETFERLVHHLPTTELSKALAELETKGSVSLYKEDEPNTFMEPGVLSQMLVPFLFQLLTRVSQSPRLCESVKFWLKATGPGVVPSLQHCMNWWSQDDNASLHLKALGCPKVHIAITALLVKATLVAHMLAILERGKQPTVEGISFCSEQLRCTILSVQKLFARLGIAPTINVTMHQ